MNSLHAVALSLVLVGCGDPGSSAPSAGASTTVSVSAKSSPSAASATPASGSAQPTAAATASASAPPRAPAHRCAVTDPKKPAALGTIANLEQLVDAGDGSLYLTTWNTSTLKGEVLAVPVDASGQKKLWAFGPEKSANDAVSSLAMAPDAIYLTKSGALMRMKLEGGAPESVADGFGSSVSVSGEFAYGLRYDAAGKRDVAVRVPTKGGPVEELYARPREGGGERPGFAAITATDRYAFIADSGKRTLLRVELASKTATELASGLAYPNGAHVAGESVFVTTQTTGVYRVPIAGGKAEEVSGKGDKVDALYGFDATHLYAYDSGPSDGGPDYLPLSRISLGGGKPEPVHSVKTSLTDFVVGSDCLYLVFRDDAYAIMAYAKSSKP